MTEQRDGFIVCDEQGVEQSFVSCSFGGYARDRAHAGLLGRVHQRNGNWFVKDTRDETGDEEPCVDCGWTHPAGTVCDTDEEGMLT